MYIEEEGDYEDGFVEEKGAKGRLLGLGWGNGYEGFCCCWFIFWGKFWLPGYKIEFSEKGEFLLGKFYWAILGNWGT